MVHARAIYEAGLRDNDDRSLVGLAIDESVRDEKDVHDEVGDAHHAEEPGEELVDEEA